MERVLAFTSCCLALGDNAERAFTQVSTAEKSRYLSSWTACSSWTQDWLVQPLAQPTGYPCTDFA